jgi:hypothetical protein
MRVEIEGSNYAAFYNLLALTGIIPMSSGRLYKRLLYLGITLAWTDTKLQQLSRKWYHSSIPRPLSGHTQDAPSRRRSQV